MKSIDINKTHWYGVNLLYNSIASFEVLIKQSAYDKRELVLVFRELNDNIMHNTNLFRVPLQTLMSFIDISMILPILNLNLEKMTVSILLSITDIILFNWWVFKMKQIRSVNIIFIFGDRNVENQSVLRKFFD